MQRREEVASGELRVASFLLTTDYCLLPPGPGRSCELRVAGCEGKAGDGKKLRVTPQVQGLKPLATIARPPGEEARDGHEKGSGFDSIDVT